MGFNDCGSTPFDESPDEGRDQLPAAPTPPHERAWRHPSEIGYADYRATPPPDIGRTGRGLVAFAVLSGCVMLIGLLVVVRPDDGRRSTSDIVRLSSSDLSIASIASNNGTGFEPAPLAVHISETPFLVTTKDAVGDESAQGVDGVVEIQLADGDAALAHVVVEDGRLVVLSIADETSRPGLNLPFSNGVSNGQLVTVALSSGDASFVVDEFEVDNVDGAMILHSLAGSSPESMIEGAPVVDRTGRFVGFISVASGRAVLIPAEAAARLLERIVSSDDGDAATPPAPTTP